jgi:D-glycero-alpha-D-manno-heptose 1-phosphate guanylyltransferase
MEAIILAGGLGTRLRPIVSDLPKPMAPIRGKPFLQYIFEYLRIQGIRKVVLSTGYKHQMIESYFGSQYHEISLVYSQEKEPLGTGGAVKKALENITTNHVFVLNGDTFFNINLEDLYQLHLLLNSDVTLALKPMKNPARYGIIKTAGDKVLSFNEKSLKKQGTINGGIYVLKKNLFKGISISETFSFEQDFLKKYADSLQFNAYKSDAFFIDIGIPEDYQAAQRKLPYQL